MPSDPKKSFEALALPHLGLLFRIARHMSGDEHAAEDLVQETCLRAYKSFNSYEIRDFGIRPWLLKIMHNVFLTRVAQDSRSARFADSTRLDGLQDTLADRDEAGFRDEVDFDLLDSEVKKALEGLQPEFRTVLLLWATMEFSYQDISRIVGAPVGTVMSRLHRARQQLSRTLQQYGRDHRRLQTRDPDDARTHTQ
jgi:RNA polymerase sigma-70 factor (ECF subfamily)